MSGLWQGLTYLACFLILAWALWVTVRKDGW
jgi:hypothetical protein